MVSIKEFPFRFFIWNSADSGQRFGLKRWLKSKDLVFLDGGEDKLETRFSFRP